MTLIIILVIASVLAPAFVATPETAIAARARKRGKWIKKRRKHQQRLK